MSYFRASRLGGESKTLDHRECAPILCGAVGAVIHLLLCGAGFRVLCAASSRPSWHSWWSMIIMNGWEETVANGRSTVVAGCLHQN
jgi:hypothetical protein